MHLIVYYARDAVQLELRPASQPKIPRAMLEAQNNPFPPSTQREIQNAVSKMFNLRNLLIKWPPFVNMDAYPFWYI